MAKYRVETNKGTFEVESDREPTQADVEAYLAAQEAPQAPAPVATPQSAAPPPDQTMLGGLARGLNTTAMLGNPYSQTPPINPMGVADMGVEAGAGAVGQMTGAATGPLAPVAVPVLGAGFSMGGNALAQFRQMKMGERENFGLGEFFGAGVAGAIPGGPLAGAGLKTFAKEAGKASIANLTAKATENVIDGKPLLSGKEAATAGLGAVLGVSIARGLDAGKNPLAIAASIEEAQDAGKRYALKLAKELDLVIPPSMVRSSYPNDVLGSFGGSAAINRKAIEVNQGRFNKLIREDIGVEQDAKLMRDPETRTVKVLESKRIGPNAVYKEVESVNDSTAAALKLFQEANSRAAQLRQYRDSYPKDNALRLARDAAEASREEGAKLLKSELNKAEKGELWGKFEEARKKLAKIGLAESAMNDATGDFDPSLFGRMWEDGPKLLDGRMEQVGRFWNAFHHVAKDANSQLPVAINQLNAMAGAVSGDPKVLLTTTGLPRLARDIALSRPYQISLERFYGPTRQDAPAMLARLAAMSAGRKEQPAPRPVPYR
jgi:hypothetical protein